MTRQRKCAHWEFSGRIKRNLFVTSALSVSYDVSFATSSDRSLWSSTLCKKFCEWKKLKSSNISGKMFQIFVCLFIFLVILGENFNVTIFSWTSQWKQICSWMNLIFYSFYIAIDLLLEKERFLSLTPCWYSCFSLFATVLCMNRKRICQHLKFRGVEMDNGPRAVPFFRRNPSRELKKSLMFRSKRVRLCLTRHIKHILPYRQRIMLKVLLFWPYADISRGYYIKLTLINHLYLMQNNGSRLGVDSLAQSLVSKASDLLMMKPQHQGWTWSRFF